MDISKHIQAWAKQVIKESEDDLNETNYPCTDGFPQAEKDICTCPDCGEKMYETEELTEGDTYTSDEQIPDLMIKENEETPISSQDEMTLKEFFEKAKQEDGELQVHFVKVTDDQERTVIFSNAAGVEASFDDQVSIGPKVLKTITKTYDRVYEQDVKYFGSLVTFPEKVTEETPHVTNTKPASDGTMWQWRRLYIQQIIDVKYNGKVVWENNGLFNFNLAGKDGKQRSTVSRDDFEKQRAAREEYNKQQVARDAQYKAMRKQAVELAKTMSEEDCSIDLDYASTNAFDGLDDKNKIKVMAIQIKHDQLCRTNPEKHKMVDTSRNPMRGDHSEHCKGCKFGYSWDSSD